MADEGQARESGGSDLLVKISLGIMGIIAILALFLVIMLRQRVSDLETRAKSSEANQQQLADRESATAADLRNTAKALGDKVGMTQDELAQKTAEIRRQQEASRRLEAAQKQTEQKVAGVSGEVAGVKTDLGGAKADIATTKTDLAATQMKLEKTIGDLGVQSGLIAKNHDELEELKHKGDRNYFEFTLKKNAHTVVGPISLELKKTDAKKNKFTLNVIADDKTIEKKDRTLAEPMQFYSGKDHRLFEIVVFTVGKNDVSGYLSTPK